ncbi:MAG: TSUP family transporter [Betaproteobacteria bacterium]|nr:TSUP family transporter [Betaproteobacteria bacterium]
MEDLPAWQLAFCALVIVAAFAVRGTAGFGGGAVAVPLMALALPVQVVVPVVAVLNLLASTGHATRHRRLVLWREVAYTIPFTAIGVAGGVYLLNELDAALLRKGLGLFVVAYAVFAFATATRPLRAPRALLRPLGAILSTTAGFLGALFGGAAGPLYAIYFSNLELARDVFRVTVTTTLLVQAALRATSYAGLGLYDRTTLIVLAVALPFMWLGGRLAERVAGRIEPHTFGRVVGAVLLASGAALLFK